MTKWLTGVSPFDRAVYVAARSLESRLDAVRHYLRRCVKKPRNPENVHQLRVWSRRAEAALALYADLLPERRRKWLERALRKSRRAAGRIRDCDVFAARVSRERTRWPANLAAERLKAQRKLVTLFEKLDCGRKLKRRSAHLVRRLREDQGDAAKSFAQRARECLSPLATAFFAASPETNDDATLHRFRIAGKSLRYAVELLAGAFPPSLRTEFYPVLTALQEKLGAVNDLAVACARLRESIAHTGNPAKLSALRRRLAVTSKELLKAKDAFSYWWTPESTRSLRVRFDEIVSPSLTFP